MELQRTRILLLLSLFVVGMFLYSHWQQKYLPVAASEISNSHAQPTSHTNSDVPQDMVSMPQQDVVEAGQSIQTVRNSGALIHVKTDVIDAKIDTKGGDIVFAKLPQYPVSLELPDQGFQLLDNDGDRYYVAQSGLIGLKNNGPDSKEQGRAQYAFQQSDYTIAENQDTITVPLKWSKDGIEVIKTYIFERGKYLVDVQYTVKNNTQSAWAGSFYGQIKREKQEKKGGMMGVQMYQGAAAFTQDKPYKKISYSDMEDAPFRTKQMGGWAAMLERYFLTAWIPDASTEHNYYSTVDKNVYGIGSISTFEVLPGESKTVSSQLYMGPEIAEDLKQISAGLELTVDYGILWPISQLLFWLLKNIHDVLGNWGWSIIALTFLIKVVFYKLSAKSYRSMAHMKAVQPKIEALKERCGDDKQQFSQGLLALYKKEKVNPLGGCLPILIQIPVFIALYYVLLESVELRQAPFIFWIQDLSIKDPFYVLPLIMGASMFFQQKMNPPPPDPMQAKVMMAMPIVFTVLFLSFPAGLVLYWVANNLLSMLQQWYIQNKFGKEPPKPTKKNNKKIKSAPKTA